MPRISELLVTDILKIKMALLYSPTQPKTAQDKCVEESDGTARGTQHDEAPERSNEVHGNEFRNVRLQTFWPTKPKLWFRRIESEFHAYRIKSDDTRFDTVIRHLDVETMTAIEDILEDLPDTGKYELVKNTLISRFSSSEEKQIQTLLHGLELGERAPSALLREMRALAGTNVTDSVLRTLWLQRMPQRIREVFVVLGETDLNKLAASADIAWEQSSGFNISAVAQTNSARQPETANDALVELVKSLRLEVNALRNENDERRERSRSRGRSASRGWRRKPGRSGSRGRRPLRDGTPGHCWYHQQFQERSWTCRPPCQAPYPLAQRPENFSHHRQ